LGSLPAQHCKHISIHWFRASGNASKPACAVEEVSEDDGRDSTIAVANWVLCLRSIASTAAYIGSELLALQANPLVPLKKYLKMTAGIVPQLSPIGFFACAALQAQQHTMAQSFWHRRHIGSELLALQTMAQSFWHHASCRQIA
jgi:hypothetical protein